MAVPDLDALLRPWTPDDLSERLGLRPEDADDTVALIGAVLGAEGEPGDEAARAVVTTMVERLQDNVGRFDPVRDAFADLDADHRLGAAEVIGGRALLALIAAAPAVVEGGRGRRISDEQSWHSLSDLGQQMWVHRRTFGGFGLHTFGWLNLAWSGALQWLGRLQFNLHRPRAETGAQTSEWWLSVHIPERGPLDPGSVQESMAAALDFFAEHFPDAPVTKLHCNSWLLDPFLAEQLPGTNMAAFCELWTPTGRRGAGNGDALFFTFRRRGDIRDAAHPDAPLVLAELPQDSRLQRLVVQRITEGGQWETVEGTLELDQLAQQDPA